LGTRKFHLACLQAAGTCATVPIRVLIADDSELIRRQIRTTLEPEKDIEVCAEAENGLEAVRKTLECRPDLVVIDVIMPVMNGLAATEDVKMLMPNVRVLAMTLYDSHQIRIESERAGADAVMMKAEGGIQLARTIRVLCKRTLEP
jgi:DNA-binding NarL/FixJ family response regulator